MKNNLQPIFNKLKKLLKPNERRLNVKSDYDSRYELEGTKEYEVMSEKTGKVSKRKNAYFGGIIIQSSYVGLYLMAPYMNPQKFNKRFPKLMKLLKGKSCFHVKDIDNVLERDIKGALKLSFGLYREGGFV